MSPLGPFLDRLNLLPVGYSEGYYQQRRYGTTLKVSEDGRRVQLFARELGGSDFISFNLFRLGSGRTQLKPCEMKQEKVVSFVLEYRPETPPRSERRTGSTTA
jgi:hypothetical protein